MDFEPIEIGGGIDLRRWSEIAYLIDSPRFIEEAKKIRQKYKISKPMRNENEQRWVLTNIPKEKISYLFGEITRTRNFLGYESQYQAIFEKAVLGGIIEDSDYKHTLLFNFSKLPNFLTKLQNQEYGILLTPQTDKKDVIVAFSQYQKIQETSQSDQETYISIDNRIDEGTEIKEHRDWYWKHENKRTYWQIAQSEGINRDQFDDFYKDRIAKAIKSYKQKLGIQ